MAALPFAAAAAVSGCIALTVVPVALLWLKEPTTLTRNGAALINAYNGLRSVFQSRDVWAAAVFIFLVNVPQTFQTPVYYFQKSVLELSDTTIGVLGAVAAAGGLLAAALYAFISPRLSLRILLASNILGAVLGTLIYIFYDSFPAAIVIEATHGFMRALLTLALLELAVLATPGGAPAAGYALLMSAWNLGNAIGDYLASALVGRSFMTLFEVIDLYAGATALTLCAILFLPNKLLDHRDIR